MRVAFCWPVNKEPDLRPVIAQWASEQHPGFTALLPVVIDESSALRFRAWSPATPMRADRHGIPTPASGDFLVPQALLLPVNGFDAAGYRIGYGGGYFDRTLPGLAPRPLVVGVGFEVARLDSIRPEAHDQRGARPAARRDGHRGRHLPSFALGCLAATNEVRQLISRHCQPVPLQFVAAAEAQLFGDRRILDALGNGSQLETMRHLDDRWMIAPTIAASLGSLSRSRTKGRAIFSLSTAKRFRYARLE